MREAWHTNEDKLYIIPQNSPVAVVDNHNLKRQLEEEELLAKLIAKEKREQAIENQQAYLERYSQNNYSKSDKDRKRELVMKAFHSNN